MGPCEAVVLPVVWQCVEEAASVVEVLEEEELCPEEQLEECPEVRGLLLFNSAYLCSTSELSFFNIYSKLFYSYSASHSSARLKVLHVTVETLTQDNKK